MKTHIILFLFTGVFISLLSGCKKEDDVHPEIETSQIIALSPVKALLKGTIQNTGSFDVVDFGFMYSTNSSGYYTPIGGSSSSSTLSESWGTKVSLGRDVKQGEFSTEITVVGSYNYPATVYARAYISNSNGTIYGKIINVSMPAMGTPAISQLSGKTGDLITLNGQFYSLTKSDVSVKFNNTTAEVTEVTPSKATVKIPSGVTASGSYYNSGITVSIKIGDISTTITNNFKITPTFTSLSSTTGIAGTSMYILTDNTISDYTYSNYKVYFGQTAASISGIDGNRIYVNVPSNLTEAKVSVSAEYNGVKTILPGEFTLTPPTITSISPSSGFPGSVFYINGTNLQNSTVSIGNVNVTGYYNYSSQLSVTIPNTVAAGDHKVTVKSGPYSIDAPQNLTVKTISVTGFTPTSGAVGKEVTVQGSFNPNQSYNVNFGTSTAYAHNVTSTTLRAYVPSGTILGNVKIAVLSGTLSYNAPGDFTIIGPTITSFSPATAIAGTAVTITGTGFSTYAYSNTVKFGTIATPVLSATETTLIVAVPSGLTPGSMKISVAVNGQTVISTGNFTFTN